LLGEDIGVSLPRHVRSFLAELPGVNEALSAAFFTVAVATIGIVIAEGIEKLMKMSDEVNKMTREFDASAVSITKHAQSLATDNLKMEDNIAKLEGRPSSNRLAIALGEAASKASELAANLEAAIQKEADLLEDHSVNLIQSMITGKSTTSDISDAMKPYLQQLMQVLQAEQLAVAQFENENIDQLNSADKKTQKAAAEKLATLRQGYKSQIDTIVSGEDGALAALKTAQSNLDTQRAEMIKSSKIKIQADASQGASPEVSDEDALAEAIKDVNSRLSVKQSLVNSLRISFLGAANDEAQGYKNISLIQTQAAAEDTKEAKDRKQATEDRVLSLESEANAIMNKAGAQHNNTSATIADTAAANANKIITDINREATAKQVPLLTQVQESRIRAAEALKVFGSAATDVSTTTAKDILKITDQTNKVRDLALAFAQGGSAIAAAQEKAQLAPYQEKVAQLAAAFVALKGVIPDKEYKALGAALAEAQRELSLYTAAVHALDQAEREAKTSDMMTTLMRSTTAAQGMSVAILRGSDAVRKFNIDQKVMAYQLNADMDQAPAAVERYRQALMQADQAQRQQAAAGQVAAQEKFKDYAQEISDLQNIRAEVVAMGQSTVAVDGAIKDATNAQIAAYNQLMLKVGTVRQGFKAMLSDYTHDTQSMMQKVDQIWKQGMSGIETNLSQLIATGKANFTQLAQSMIEAVSQMAIHWVLQHTIMTAADKIFHTNAQDDSDEAMAAQMVNNVALGDSNAAVAATGAFAYYSAFDPENALDMAFEQYMEGMGLASMAAFERGGRVPRTGIALVHQDETILPASMSGRGVSGLGGGGSQIHLHTGSTINAIDGDSVKRMLDQHGDKIAADSMRRMKRIMSNNGYTRGKRIR
jgi:hypothetical protein